LPKAEDTPSGDQAADSTKGSEAGTSSSMLISTSSRKEKQSGLIVVKIEDEDDVDD
jgi:hypothetical protein